jgi:CubicO group peptidase (beta-lactamase class C family)
MKPLRLSLLLLCASSFASAGERLPLVRPAEVGLDAETLAAIDEIVAEEIEAGEMPGCVVCIGRGGRIAFLKAYGHRQIEPDKIAMTVDTVFDMASITKPVATATSIMLLIERGELGLQDRIAAHLPAFAANGKEKITVEDCLLHQSGLTPDNALGDYEGGPEEAMKRVIDLPLRGPVKTRFMYSDVGFIVLAELIRAKTGKDVHQFSQANIFEPLGMSETGFLPNDDLRRRAAPTEQRGERWLQGEVHDPRAHLLGGIAGHAGLFSTAEDLAVYAQMMLNGGQYGGKRVLSAQTIAVMTNDYRVSSGLRGLGWDKRTGFSSNRGQGMSDQAFGHGGFTGTVLWIDPQRDLFVIFLSNRLHPDGQGTVNPLAGRIGTIAVEAIR